MSRIKKAVHLRRQQATVNHWEITMLRTIRTPLVLLGILTFAVQNATADIYALRIGDGSAFTGVTAAADASAVFVDKLSDAGALISTINLPQALSGANHPLTLPAASTSVGHLSLSTDGQYLVLAGCDAP